MEPTEERRGRRARWLLRIVLFALGWLAVDGGASLLLGGEDFRGEPLAPFDPPFFNDRQRANFERYNALLEGRQAGRFEAVLDPELGWAPKPAHRASALYYYDWSGSRVGVAPLARTKEEGVRRVVAVGCSFTRGDEVTGPNAWPARVDFAREDLEVANLGVGGYGMDQALLRLERDGLPLEPDEVWLGFVPRTALRVTSQFPPARNHQAANIVFKARFELDEEGALALVPNPAPTIEAVLALYDSQAAFFAAIGEHERAIQRAPAAYLPRGTHWSHWLASTRLWLTGHEAGGRDAALELGRPESEVYRLCRAIVLRARESARGKGARFRLWILPSAADLKRFGATGRPYWGTWVEELRRAGVEVHEFTEALGGEAAWSSSDLWMEGGHYSVEANRRVAEAMLSYLEDPR